MLRFHIGKMEEDRWKHCWVEVDGAAFRSIILLSVIILCGGFLLLWIIQTSGISTG